MTRESPPAKVGSSRSPDEVTGDTNLGFFARVPEAVLLADVSSNAVRVYGLLDRRAGEEHTCWPSRTTIAREMRCGRRTVDRALRELEAAGFVTTTHRTDEGGEPTSNLYYLVPRLTLRSAKDGTTPRQGWHYGGAKDGTTGSAKDVAQNKTQLEVDPVEPNPGSESASYASLLLRPDVHGAELPVLLDALRTAHPAEDVDVVLDKFVADNKRFRYPSELYDKISAEIKDSAIKGSAFSLVMGGKSAGSPPGCADCDLGWVSAGTTPRGAAVAEPCPNCTPQLGRVSGDSFVDRTVYR